MMIVYALLGFLIGQIITVEGIRLDRLIHSLLGLFLVGLFIILPTLAMVSMIYAFQLDKTPAALVSVCIVFSHGMVEFLKMVAHSMRPDTM